MKNYHKKLPHEKIYKYWEVVKLLVFQSSRFYLKVRILSSATNTPLFFLN